MPNQIFIVIPRLLTKECTLSVAIHFICDYMQHFNRLIAQTIFKAALVYNSGL